MRAADYKNHTIWGTLDTFKATLGTFGDDKKQDERFTALVKLHDYVHWMLRESEPWFISSTELDQTNQEIQQATQYLAKTQNNWSYISNIEQAFQPTLQRFGYPRVRKFSKAEASNLINALTLEINKLKNELHNLENQAQRVQSYNHEASEYLSKIQDDINTRLDEVRSDFQLETKKRIEEFKTRNLSISENLRRDIDLQITKTNEDAKAKQSERAQEFNNFIKNSHDRFSDTESSLNSTRDEAKKTLTEIVGIYEMAGDNLLAGGFVQAHQQENDLYVLYSRIAAFLFLIGATLLYLLSYKIINSLDFTLKDIVIRLPISLVALLPGLYLASLAGKHRAASIALRSLGLRIKAFEAYLSSASEDQRAQLRETLAGQFFTEPTSRDRRSISIDGKNIDALTGLVDKLISKIPVDR